MELLPAETLLSVEVRGLERLMKGLGTPGILTHGGQAGSMAQVMLDQSMRAWVEDPGRLRDIGIDPAGSTGFAVLDVRAKSMAFWMTLSDRKLLEAEFEHRSGQKLEFGGTRAAEIAALDERTRVIVRDGFVFVVTTARPDRASRDIARALADARPQEGLRHDPSYARASAGREQATALLYMNPGRLLVELSEDEFSERERQSSRMGELKWLIDKARRGGASSAELVELESELRAVARDASDGTHRDAEVWRQVHAMVQPVDALSVAFEATAGEIRADGRMNVPDSQALVRRLVKDLPGPSWLARSLMVAPMSINEAAFDPLEMRPLLEAVMIADHENPDELDREMRAELGVSWRDDILGAMTGEVGGGVYFRRPPSFRHSDRLEDQLDFMAYAGIVDRAAVLDSLKRFAESKEVKRELKPKRLANGWRFRLDSKHSVDAVLGKEHIFFASEANLASSYAKGKTGAGMSAVRMPELLRPFESGKIAMRGLLDLMLPFALEARRPMTRSLEDYDYRFRWYRELGPDKVDGIAVGRVLRKKRARLKKLYSRYNAKASARSEKELSAELKLAKRLGYLSADLHEVADGFEGSLVWKFQRERLVKLMLDAFDDSQGRDFGTSGELATLESEIRELEYEIEQARYAELDRWLEKHPQSPSVVVP
jgi:hypothetical protein